MEFLRMLEEIRTPLLTTLFSNITRLGEETVLIVVLCAIYWCISKRAAYIIGIAYFISALAVQGMKICFRVDRPWVLDPALNTIESAKVHATGYSFPSGHTQSSSALFGSLGFSVKNVPVKIICFLLLLLVGFSRMYLGVHTPQDVLVSMALTLLIVFAVTKLVTMDTADKKREIIISLSIIVIAAAVIIIASALRSAGDIEEGYVRDCLKAAGVSIGFAIGMYVERIYIDFSEKTKNIALQILKFALGLAGVLIIKEGLKFVIGTSIPADISRYFLMAIWMTLGYPLIIKRFFEEKKTEAAA